jgi:hypothetical protein
VTGLPPVTGKAYIVYLAQPQAMSRLRSLITVCIFLAAAATCRAGVFDVVKTLPPPQRMAKTQEIYNQQVKRQDSVLSIASIRELITIANELDDRPLQCLSISLLADQYARIRGENDHSTQLHHDAIALAEGYRLPLLIGICNYRMGRYYYSFKNYPFAFEYLLRADNYFHDIGYKDVPDIDEILYFIGSIYYETGNYDKAENFLQHVQQLNYINEYVQKQSLNTLALISKQLNDTAQALRYFQQTLDAAIARHDSTWMGISYSNMGSLYFSAQQYEKAYPLLVRGAGLSHKYKQWGDAFMDLLLLARIDIMQDRVASAQKKIDSAMALQQFYFTMPGRKSLYEAQALYYEKTNRQDRALEFQHKLMLVKDSLTVSRDQQTYKKIQLRMETEKHLGDIDKLESAANAAALKRNAVIAVLVLVVVVLLMLYGRYRQQAKNAAAILLQKQRLLEAEKLRAEEKLKYARQLLQNFTENTKQKNEMIEKFSMELERLKSSMPGNALYEERLKNFDKLVQSTILADSDWDDFRKLFDKVHKGFFSRLEEKFPGLPVNDERLLALIKLGLNNLEIANMMGITAYAIEHAKQRLRQNMYPVNNSITMEDLVQAI